MIAICDFLDKKQGNCGVARGGRRETTGSSVLCGAIQRDFASIGHTLSQDNTTQQSYKTPLAVPQDPHLFVGNENNEFLSQLFQEKFHKMELESFHHI